MNKKLKNIITIICMIIYTVSSSYLIININNFGIIPNKYLTIIYIVITILLILYLFSIRRKYIIFNILGIILLIITSVGYILVSNYINVTNNAINKVVSNQITTISYNIIVKKSNSINKLSELKNQTISYIEDENSDKLLKLIEKKVNINKRKLTDYNEILNNFMNDEAIILNSGYTEALEDELEEFSNNYKILYTFTIKKDTKDEEIYSDIIAEPFVLYISGIDTYGKISTRSRSDVNILVAVNPNTHKILLVNTPRDYYVQLHGTTGLKDKLTHAGIYGIEKSKTTMEDLYGISINDYVRVNFNTLISVVDEIGGIVIDSDTSFTCHTDRNVVVTKGINKFNGKQALAYSRERYAYTSGDRHRGQNQEQVIAAIINKITSTNSLISNYNKILNTLSNSFETSLSDSELKSFAKMQLDKNIRWNIESISVDGTGAKDYTYSMGTNYLLYVMLPNQNTIDIAKVKIDSVLKNK